MEERRTAETIYDQVSIIYQQDNCLKGIDGLVWDNDRVGGGGDYAIIFNLGNYL